MLKHIIDIQNAGKLYGDFRALENVGLTVLNGETLGLVGPNGAGKTTLLEIIQGINNFSEGFISLWEKDVLHGLGELKNKIGVSPQKIALPNYLTVYEILCLYRTIYQDGFSAEDLIDRVDLVEKKDVRFGKLSGGQQRRLAVALALIGDPELLILDEPTGDLDPQGRRFIWDLIKHTNRHVSRTTIIATHQMDEAETLCERIVIIDHGKVLDIGSPQALIEKHSPGHKILFEVSVSASKENSAIFAEHNAVLNPVEGIISVVIDARSMNHSLEVIKQLNDTLTVPLDNLQIKQSTLEDVFIKLTGRGLRD